MTYGPDTKTRIVGAADDLFYRQGFDHTSFADIADAVRISRGNFYFHFKTKDQILDAVIGRRMEASRQRLESYERGCGPADAIRKFINIVIDNKSDIKRFGCPLGTLSGELSKLDHASRTQAVKLLALFREWLRAKFTELGFGEEADDYAMHVLAWSQGVATLTNAFRDDRFIRREVEQINAWLDMQLETTSSRTRQGKA
ncbi:MAG: TetR/AcrR family transcriptional regulator [Pseudomonadota bacterium]